MKFITSLIFGLLLVTTPVKADPKMVAQLTLIGSVDEEHVKPLVFAIDKLNESDSVSAIVLEINTMGGSVDDGMVLAKRIERSKIPVICIVDGEAASMGSFILESCHTRVMTKRSLLMIHEAAIGSNYGGGQPTSWRNATDYVVAITSGMYEHYAAHTGISIKELQARTYGGRAWFMNWEEAQRLHMVDFVVDSYNDIFLEK